MLVCEAKSRFPKIMMNTILGKGLFTKIWLGNPEKWIGTLIYTFEHYLYPSYDSESNPLFLPRVCEKKFVCL
jgi:hypothetical protein